MEYQGCLCEEVGTLFQMSGQALAQELKRLQEDSSEAEYRSWVNSTPLLVEAVHRAGLDRLSLALEYQTPIGNRIDGVLLGRRLDTGKPLALIFELKQWSAIGENTLNMETAVSVRLGGEYEYRLHPIQQTMTYEQHLRMNHSAVADGGIEVRSCQYLHNFEDKEQLFRGNYSAYASRRDETYVKGEEEALADWLRKTFSPEPDPDTVKRFLTGTYVFGQAGFDALAKVFAQRENMVMIEDQVEITRKLDRILDGLHDGDTARKLVVISGPPGTGKTVVGMHIIYSYCRKFGVTGRNDGRCIFSMPFSKTLSAVITGASRIAPVYLDRIPPDRDVVVVDEAHRIKDLERTMGDLIQKARVIVILQDDRQRIRPAEEGTLENFRRFAQTRGLELVTGTLVTQKRARQLGSYVADLDRLLYDRCDEPIRQSGSLKPVCWDSLLKLDEHLHSLFQSGRHVKWYAPFCWPWSGRRPVNICLNGEVFQRDWNPRDEQYAWYMNRRPEDLEQIGCIYTAQGLEYDDTGVIWWDDLRWDPAAGDWRVNLSRSCDNAFVRAIRSSGLNTAEVTELFLNVYRVLLTRARGSVHIWFKDPATRDHVRKVLNF